MLVLNTTTDKIQVLLISAITTNQHSCYVGYRDITTISFTGKRTVAYTNSTTPVDIVPSPSVNTQRVVDHLSVYNRDVAPNNITVRFNDNGTTYDLFKCNLGSGEKLEYNDGDGFKVITNGGGLRTNSGVATLSYSENVVVLASDVAISLGANVLGNVNGLSFPALSGGTYYFRCVATFNSNATTNGCRWTISGPASSVIAVKSLYSLTTTTQTLNHGVNAYDSPAASSTSVAVTAGNRTEIEGIITFTASGTLQVRVANETAGGTITVKAGSTLQYQLLSLN